MEERRETALEVVEEYSRSLVREIVEEYSRPMPGAKVQTEELGFEEDLAFERYLTRPRQLL